MVVPLAPHQPRVRWAVVYIDDVAWRIGRMLAGGWAVVFRVRSVAEARAVNSLARVVSPGAEAVAPVPAAVSTACPAAATATAPAPRATRLRRCLDAANVTAMVALGLRSAAEILNFI